MHISIGYGEIDQGAKVLALRGLSSPSDSWQEGARQKELNEFGAYIHRFNNQNSSNSMIAAVKKIAEDSICTPCTLVGPSLCRSYNHFVWDGCAALLFAPSMPITIAYKGDIYSNRLAQESNLSHQVFKKDGLDRSESLRLFADEIQSRFNRYSTTSSAFKGRRSKKLNLVNSASHQLAKVREMEKRANLYFTPRQNFPTYDVDRPSKFLILDLSEHYKDFELDNKPLLKTRAQVLDFIDTVASVKPELAPFLAAPKIKISAFKDESAIAKYFDKTNEITSKKAHERSYVEFLKWQFSNRQTGAGLANHVDYSTALTPNEVLGMPSTEDLVGLIIDPSTSKSFDQALATLDYLKGTGMLDWVSVAHKVPPYTHLISHMDEGTLIQLGWSKMIIPYSTSGLKEFCTTGKITAIDGVRFAPDYFALLHRIASNSILIFSKGYLTVDLLHLKNNVIGNFHSIVSDRGNCLMFEVIQLDDVHMDTLRLFFHLDRMGNENLDHSRHALTNPSATSGNKGTISKLISLRKDEIDQDLVDLLVTNINRVERAHYKSAGGQRKINYRSGIKDEGLFEYNPALRSLSLVEGVRKSTKNECSTGLFKKNSDMKVGGSQLAVGVVVSGEKCKFGDFISEIPPFCIVKMNNAKNLKYFRLKIDNDELILEIDFSFHKVARMYCVLHGDGSSPKIKIRIDNPDWHQSLDQVIQEPAVAMRFVSSALRAASSVQAAELSNALLCLVVLRNAVSVQSTAVQDCLKVVGNTRSKEQQKTRDLIESFESLLQETEQRINSLVQQYKISDPCGAQIESKLQQFKGSSVRSVRSYLSHYDVLKQQSSPIPVVAPIAAATVSLPASVPNIHSIGSTLKKSKESFFKAMIFRLKQALKSF